MVLADIFSGEVDQADFVFLLAFLVAVAAVAYTFWKRNVLAAVGFVILGLLSLAWLLL